MHVFGAVIFGLLAGIVLALIDGLLGGFALYLVMGVLLLRFTTVLWQRTRLPVMTGGLALATVVVLALAGLTFKGTSVSIQLVLVCIVVATFRLCYAIEKRWHPDKMNEWERANNDAALADLIRLKHIPDLAGGDTQTTSPPPRQQ